MATLTIPITVEQIHELARQLSPQERRALLNSLLAERFDAVLSESDRRRGGQPMARDEEVQAEVDAVRGARTGKLKSVADTFSSPCRLPKTKSGVRTGN